MIECRCTKWVKKVDHAKKDIFCYVLFFSYIAVADWLYARFR